MLNPNDIANQKFDKSMGRGYKADEVDQYLGQVADEMNNLLVEKQELEQKLMVLADKLEEYKHDEESLRSALLGAQKLGDSVVRDAKAKAEMIINEANTKATLLVENAKKEIEKQQAGFVRMQREVATFKSKLQLVYKQHLEMISSIPVDESIVNNAIKQTQADEAATATRTAQPEEAPAVTAEEAVVDNRVDEYDIPIPAGGLEYSEQELEYTSEEEYTPAPEPEQPYTTRRESRFGPLKFGKEFDIKRDDEKRKK